MLRKRFEIALLLSLASLIGTSGLATAAEVTLPDGGRCQGEISNGTLNGKGSCNYANGDMVGHTGVFDAAVKAVEALDVCLGRLYAAIKEVGGEMIITADHGNVEQMMDNQTGQAHTAHTCELVPFAYVGRKATIKQGGVLSDVAPTLLTLMGLPIPAEMTGKVLIDLQ